jgi:hypothetical protein
MDLNALFFRQQQERIRAELAASEAARSAHAGLARCFEDEIARRTEGRIRIPHLPQLEE